MSEFICNKCGKIFHKKYNYNQHQKRKTSCLKKNDTNDNIIEDTNNYDDIIIDNNDTNIIDDMINNVKLNLIDKNEVYLYIRQLLW